MSTQSVRIRRSVSVLTVALALSVAACSSGGSSPSTGASGGSTPAASSSETSSTTNLTYTGPEANLPSVYPAAKTTGSSVKVGIDCPICSVPGVALWVKSAKAEIESLGGQAVVVDAAGDPQKQLNLFKQLEVQGVQAILVQPLVDTAMTPAFQDAKSKGIAVITVASPGDTTKPLLAGALTNVSFGLDKAAFEKARYLASELPKGSQIGVIGYGVPSESVKYGIDRTTYWAEKFGLKVAGEQDVTDLTASAGQTAATALLQRSPNIAGIVSFTDAISAGVVAASRLLNKPKVVACANDWDKNGYEVVSSTNGSCSTAWNWSNLGKFAADAGYIAVAKQGTLPTVVTTGGGTLVTKDNYKQVPVVG